MVRTRCYECHRPAELCFCERIPFVQNRTSVVILQHRRERLHPFNSARILAKSLANVQVLADHIHRLRVAFDQLKLDASVGLLYPGPHARLLNTLPRSEIPRQLVILDGTWHHTKTLYREIPKLQTLPQYSLEPAEPSCYTIRREPQHDYISTLEAVVAALRCLEPETEGLDRILAAFRAMIAGQVAHPKSADGLRRNLRRGDPDRRAPRMLRENPQSLVVVYGETLPSRLNGTSAGEVESPSIVTQDRSRPIVWVAERLATGESFRRIIQSPVELPSSFLRHLELQPSDFRNALSLERMQAEWHAFLRPGDTLLYYYSNLPELLACLGCENHPQFSLKSVPHLQTPTLERGWQGDSLIEQLKVLGIESEAIEGDVRADRRLRASLQLARYLQAL
jgi:DTW domain-containing protein